MTGTDSSGSGGEPHPSPEKGGFRFARELTGLIGLPILIYLIGWAPAIVFSLFMTVIAAVALWELLSMGEAKGYLVRKVLSEILLVVLLGTFILDKTSVEIAVFAALLAVPASWVFSRSPLDTALPGTAVSILGVLYIGMATGSLLRVHADAVIGPGLVFFLLVSVWAADTFAYYSGRAFGRHKLVPRISPKKTVEGLVGGIVGALIGAVVAHYTFLEMIPLSHALGLGAVLAAGGVIGDLVVSAWKRSAAVKDSGSILPGHGGILDRIDSLLFASPILYAYWFLASESFRLA